MIRKPVLSAVAILLGIQLLHAQATGAKKAPPPPPVKIGPGQKATVNMTALPPLKRQPTPKAVVDEHLAAINACDWARLMAQYPDDVEFFLPGGTLVKGRAAVGELFRGFVKPVKDGGLCGLKFTAEHTFTVGDVLNVVWVGNADFLAEPYRGVEAYVTKDGLMQAQVTTFDGTQLKLKK